MIVNTTCALFSPRPTSIQHFASRVTLLYLFSNYVQSLSSWINLSYLFLIFNLSFLNLLPCSPSNGSISRVLYQIFLWVQLPPLYSVLSPSLLYNSNIALTSGALCSFYPNIWTLAFTTGALWCILSLLECRAHNWCFTPSISPFFYFSSLNFNSAPVFGTNSHFRISTARSSEASLRFNALW